MQALWIQDIESLEEISQDDDARDLFLRMADMWQNGKIEPFLSELADDTDIDEATKGSLRELALDASFLLAVQDYVYRTKLFH
jgi:hypothetical protein